MPRTSRQQATRFELRTCFLCMHLGCGFGNVAETVRSSHLSPGVFGQAATGILESTLDSPLAKRRVASGGWPPPRTSPLQLRGGAHFVFGRLLRRGPSSVRRSAAVFVASCLLVLQGSPRDKALPGLPEVRRGWRSALSWRHEIHNKWMIPATFQARWRDRLSNLWSLLSATRQRNDPWIRSTVGFASDSVGWHFRVRCTITPCY